MKKWLISLIGLALVLAAGAGVGFALTGSDTGTAQQEDTDVTGPSAMCAEDTPDCNDTVDPGDDAREPEPSGELPPVRPGDQYEVVVQFNTSVTQEDIEETERILRAHDDQLAFLIQESWPPTGRAFLVTDVSDLCETAEELLQPESYVSDVSCELRQEADDADGDVPVEHRNDIEE